MADAAGIEDIEPPRFFHVMGCSLMANEEFRQQIIRAVAFFAEKGTRITFDPNIREELLQGRPVGEVVGPILERCSILFPGVKELQLLAGTEDISQGVERLFENPTMERVVLKRGSAVWAQLKKRRS